MGGFASSFETAASSGANSTFSGVPVGNSVGSDGGVAPASSTSSALPETGGGDWTGQAFAPSSMTQPLPEPSLPETIDWKPQPVPETPSSNLLEIVSPKPATGSGLLAENPLLQKTSESEGLRKTNPILSKLAREHPENPVHLKGGLLGAPEPAQPQIKPPNPFAHRNDELPKLPKINWGAYDKHRIDGQTRISHDDWARIITGTKDFGGIIPTMVRTAQDGGDGGKANVADVLWRGAQKNPDHARFFQRELSSALGGETIPIRQALMHGEVSPAQLVDPAKSPGLLGIAKPNRFADPDFEKSYWQSAEAYKAEFERKQQTPPATEEPRQVDPGRRGVISTNPENPAYPDRGNFAEKLWGLRASAKPFVDEPRKGTYYFGGAGMDGAYIGDMVNAMQENGVGNAQAVDRSKWSSGEEIDAPMTLLRRNRDGAQTDFSQFGKDGEQFNMVGYSHGGLQAAQAAADYASAGGKVDHLVLVGTPVSREFLDKLKSNPNIGKVIVKDIEGQGDPIRAGMSAGEHIRSLPKLMEDRSAGEEQGRSLGHFYYAGDDAVGSLRRRELAKQLYDWGLR
ncbi:MAG: alpha/beta fold hydrolase [Rhodospirillales bacterium]|jgi:hypothetical protein